MRVIPTAVLASPAVTLARAAAFDALVAEQKNTSGKNGPQLIDEALDLLLKRYSGVRREDTYR